MNGYKRRYDIFICGGSQHVPLLRLRLPRLYPFGKLHLGSITLTESDERSLRPHFDALHRPTHHVNGWENFQHFSIRDMCALASRPHFIKIDCDTFVTTDWIEYVDSALHQRPDAVLFGPEEGRSPVNIELAGEVVRGKIGHDVRVVNGMKLRGGFYVGNTEFFQRHLKTMRNLHELLYCFRDGRRIRDTLWPAQWPKDEESDELFESNYTSPGECAEDHLRSFVVHVMKAGERMHQLDAGRRIRLYPT